MKGQISLEYLSTYSWAIIILLTIVSTLTYFGFFSQRTFVEDSCETGSFLYCEDSLLNKTSSDVELKLKLRNNFADDIEIISMEILEYSDTCDPSWAGFVIQRGKTNNTPVCVINEDMRRGDVEEISFVIKYKRYPSDALTPEHTINGGIKAMVSGK